MRVLATGGAGFIGSSLGVALAARHPDWEVVAFDNLRTVLADIFAWVKDIEAALVATLESGS